MYNKQTPKPYWKYHPAEHLAEREMRIAREKSLIVDQYAYLANLRESATHCGKESQAAIETYHKAANNMLVEACFTAAQGGLDMLLTPDENEEIPYEQLFPYVSLATRVKFQEIKKDAQKLLDVHRILVEEYNNELEDYIKRIEKEAKTSNNITSSAGMALETIANSLILTYFSGENPSIVYAVHFQRGNISVRYDRFLQTRAKIILSSEQKNRAFTNGPCVEYLTITIQNDLDDLSPEITFQADNYVNSRGESYRRNMTLSVPVSKATNYIEGLERSDTLLGKKFAEKWKKGEFKNSNGYVLHEKSYDLTDLNKFIDFLRTSS